MCLSPIQIINPSKYISLKYRDKYLLSVPCGHCAECQQTLSNQWFFRSWQECVDLQQNHGFLYFDTLTYRPESLPLMSDIISELPSVSCFRPSDVRNFIECLRLHLKRKFKSSSFRYFVSSEYGSKQFTFRPHYHVLFFVKNNDSALTPAVFSGLVSKYWRFGRTDGVPYKSIGYVESHNTIFSDAIPADYLRACRYVTKYVQKSAMYDKDLVNRLNNSMKIVASKMPDNWINSVNASRVRSRLKRCINQFHHQSQHFGELFLQNLDLLELFDKGCVFMPSPKGLKIPVPLSTYYKRKLFYDLVVIDGTKCWQLNELGIKYRNYRRSKLIADLADVFYSASLTYHLLLDKKMCLNLADYVYNFQGRIIAESQSNSIFEKLPSVSFFNYVTLSDKEHLSKRGVSPVFLGNNSIGYKESMFSLIPFKNFIKEHVYIDEDKEKQLNLIYFHLSKKNNLKQAAFETIQRLEALYKDIRDLRSL